MPPAQTDGALAAEQRAQLPAAVRALPAFAECEVAKKRVPSLPAIVVQLTAAEPS